MNNQIKMQLCLNTSSGKIVFSVCGVVDEGYNAEPHMTLFNDLGNTENGRYFRM